MKILSSLFIVALTCSMLGCITPYDPPFLDGGGDILVVDGIITEGESSFILSKTISFNQSSKGYGSTRIAGARVWVESEDGQTFETLPQSAEQAKSGEYVIRIFDLNYSVRYRLRISAEGEEYESSYRFPQQTPPITEIGFSQSAEGKPVDVTVDVAGRQEGPRHYLWKYEEIWEIISDRETPVYLGDPTSLAYYSWGDAIAQSKRVVRYNYLYVDPGAIGLPPINPDNPYYPFSPFHYCWRYDKSKEILLGSAAKLSENKLVDHSVYKIDLSNERISYLYYTKITQYSLGDDAFTYMTNQKNNTNATGSIFAPMPAEMPGNIVCTTSPDTPVIGYIEVSKGVEGVGFFETGGGKPYIKPVGSAANNLVTSSFMPGNDSIAEMSRGLYLYDYDPPSPPTPAKYYFTEKRCIDCREMGGVKERPSFWPNDHK